MHIYSPYPWMFEPNKKTTNKQIFSTTFLVFSRTQSIQSMSKRTQLVHCKMHSLSQQQKSKLKREVKPQHILGTLNTAHMNIPWKGGYIYRAYCVGKFQRSIKELRPGQRVSTLGNLRL